MRLLFPAIAAIAALSSASVALAGPGCSGRSHDVTASTEMSPAHEAGPASVALAEALVLRISLRSPDSIFRMTPGLSRPLTGISTAISTCG